MMTGYSVFARYYDSLTANIDYRKRAEYFHNIINRFNFLYNNKQGLDISHNFKNKLAALILVGGGGACKFLQGTNNEDLAIKQCKYIFNKINAELKSENVILCLNTNQIKTRDNEDIKLKVKEMAVRLN